MPPRLLHSGGTALGGLVPHGSCSRSLSLALALSDRWGRLSHPGCIVPHPPSPLGRQQGVGRVSVGTLAVLQSLCCLSLSEKCDNPLLTARPTTIAPTPACIPGEGGSHGASPTKSVPSALGEDTGTRPHLAPPEGQVGLPYRLDPPRELLTGDGTSGPRAPERLAGALWRCHRGPGKTCSRARCREDLS